MSDSAEGLGVPGLSAEQLRWRCDPDTLGYETTAEVEPVSGIAGQDSAVDALTFGLQIDAPGQNIFVRGLPGTGRSSLVSRLLAEIQPACPLAPDHCYVHNFEQPDRPRLISLCRSQGVSFQARIDELIAFIRNDLAAALQSEPVQARRRALETEANGAIEVITGDLEKELEEAGLALVMMQVGNVVQPAIAPRVNGKPVPPDQLPGLVANGDITEEEVEALGNAAQSYQEQVLSLAQSVMELRHTYSVRMRDLMGDEVRRLIQAAASDIPNTYSDVAGDGDVQRFLEEIVKDVIRRVPSEEGLEFTRRYRVNVVRGHRPDEGCPIVVENIPTLYTLMGGIDVETNDEGNLEVSHMTIRAGSLVRAGGGYLVLEARDVASDVAAWRLLLRALRSGKVDIVPPEIEGRGRPTLKPDPIPVSVKVVLLGDVGLYSMLDAYDPEFSEVFKVLADFESVIPRNDAAQQIYAGVIARVADEGGLPPFHRSAVAELIEHGARIAARQGKLSVRFGRLADIAREAAFLAGRDGTDIVAGEHVERAVRRTKERAGLPGRRFRELVREGTIRIQVSGRRVGQVNGVAIAHAGPLSYGFPARITASIGPGTVGMINIEREAMLSGAIHTKGFYILSGLLRYLLRTDHPLAFNASVAFEQSYGGIDGDSASGAEMCCLLSALTDVPLRQGLAMTGAIDQVGNILPIGGVTEKTEGFFDVCGDSGLDGSHGMIVPRSNAGDLMLRRDLVEACGRGEFAVYAVDTIQQALEIFTGMPAGEMDDEHVYPEGTLLALAVERAREFWEKAALRPRSSEDSVGGAGGVIAGALPPGI